jgi:alkylation response protein AidB-like acyl-CoA dehydrogenase
VSLTTLMNERLAVGDAPGPDFDDIFALARSLELDEGPAIRNPAVREKLADWYVKTVGLKYTKFRTMICRAARLRGLKRRSPNWSAPASCRRLPPMASISWA